MKNNKSMHFFLASNSPRGFFSKMNIFDENLPGDWKCNIIKGSPGCGKSTYMKKIAKEVEEMNFGVEYIHCPSDPDSLDAVIFPDLKTCYVDGTAPHVIDPIFPGISGEIIDLGKLKNLNEAANNKEQIFDLDKNCKKFYSKSQKYLIAFSSILSNSIEQSAETLDIEKLRKISNKISKTFFKKNLFKSSEKSIRLLSSMGPKGLIFFNQNFDLYDYVYYIKDDLNLISDILLDNILKIATKKGYDSIVCINPLSLNEKIESIMFPESSLAIFVSNRWQNFYVPESKKNYEEIEVKNLNSEINLDDVDILDTLLNKAEDSMLLAFESHSHLEQLYS